MHDTRPGLDGAPRGSYLVAKLSSGEQAVIQWEAGTFVLSPDGQPRLLDNAVWRFIGGTGSLEGIKDAGILHIKALSPSGRDFELTGEAVVGKK